MKEELKNILESVTKLFLKFGIKSVSMDDIAHELGVSKKTLYQHFKDKEELIHKIIHCEHEKKRCFFNNLIKNNLNAIEESLEVYKIVNGILKDITPTVEYDLKKYYPKIHKELSEFRSQHIQETVKSNLIKGKKEGLYREDFNIDIITKLHIYRVNIMFEEDFFNLEAITSKMVFNEIFIYHLRGICSKKGLKFLEEKLDILKTQ